MPPTLASFLTIGFMAVLFRRDIKEKPNITNALWIPVLWMFLVASRPPSQWLHLFGLPGFTATTAEEGSGLDAFVFLVLIVLGARVLIHRQIKLTEFVGDNRWLMVFLTYCFIAIFWSDFPFVSFKRWIKVLGHPIMVLVVFTEPNPGESLSRLIKRCSYVILPVSILWMKYYISLGRKVSEFGGMEACGIATGKNTLAAIASALGIYFCWCLPQVWRWPKSRARRDELLLILGLLFLVAYCLAKAKSATSDICFLLGIAAMVLLAFRWVEKRAIGVYVTIVVVAFAVIQVTFDVYGTLTDLTGHSATLQSRGLLWQTLWQMDTNPLFGTGFESFWLGDRLQAIWDMPEFWWQPNQAHNGYLELYLNLGAVGVMIFAGVIFITFRKIRADLLENLAWGRFEMAWFIFILLHNWTEAGFKGLSFPFLMFFFIAVRYPGFRIEPLAGVAAGSRLLKEEEEPAYADAVV